jgi:hypothetical protein
VAGTGPPDRTPVEAVGRRRVSRSEMRERRPGRAPMLLHFSWSL